MPVSSLEVVTAADPEYACCTFRGHVLAVDSNDGSVIWDSYSIPNSTAFPRNDPCREQRCSRRLALPVWTSPTVDVARNLLIFGTGENYSSPADQNSDAVIAVRLDTGERLWSRQTFPDDAWNVACMMIDNPNCPEEDGPRLRPGLQSLMLVDLGDERTLVVAGQKDGRVFALDWETGQSKVWETKLGRGSIQGGVHFGMAAAGSTVFVPINDMNDTRNGEWLDPAKSATGGLCHRRGHRRSPLAPRAEQCLRRREDPSVIPGVSAPVTATDDAVVAGHLDGFIRIYNSETGAIVWSFDTATSVTGTNGVVAKGGSMSGSGPALGDGHLVINSGYGLYNHEAGNALLVFAPRGEEGISQR